MIRDLCAKVLAVGMLALSCGPLMAQPTQVVLSGTAAPAGSNYTYFSFLNPVLNGSGQVAFRANLRDINTNTTFNQGIFAGSVGSLQSVAVTSTTAPGGGEYFGFDAPLLNGSGNVAYYASLSTGSGIFFGSPGSVQAVALSGNAAPAGGNYSLNLSPVLNGSGQVAFLTQLTGGTPTEGIYVGSAGSVQTVALQGNAAPAGGNYNGFGAPVLNGSGQVAFYSLLSGSSYDGLFIGSAGTVTTVAIAGTAAPGGGTYNSLSSNSINPVLNSSGQVAFTATLSGSTSTQGVFAGTPGAIQAVARNNTTAPGGGNFLGFNNIVLNGSGQVAFYANLSGTSSEGLFTGTAGSLQSVARTGTAAPAGGNFNGFFDKPVLNGLGQVAFRTSLSGGTSTQGLFAGTPGALQAIVLQGQVVDGRTVNGITFVTGSGGQDGQGVSFNDSGLLVYGLSFTDGTSGIYTSVVPVPEPVSVLGIVAAGLGLAVWVRRRAFTLQVAG